MHMEKSWRERVAEYKFEEPYWFSENSPFDDFNREIILPGTNETFPDGALGIRADDDFWAVAVLPLEFKEAPLADIVGTLWPNIKNPVLNPDHHDEAAWNEIFAKMGVVIRRVS